MKSLTAFGSVARATVLIPAASLLLCMDGAVAATTPSAGAGQVREIFELSGMRSQLQTFGYELDNLVSAQQEYPVESIELVRQVVARRYSVRALESAIVENMRARQNSALATATLSWLHSPFGERVTALDSATATLEAGIAIGLYVDELRQSPPRAERAELAERLVAEMHFTETTIDLGLSLIEALVLALDATQPAERRMPTQEVRDKIAAQRAEALAESAERSHAAVLYRYRSLPSSELRELLRFVESDAGQWYHQTLWKSAKAALVEIADAAHAEIVAAIDEQRGTSTAR